MSDIPTPELNQNKDTNFSANLAGQSPVTLSPTQVAWGLWLFKYKEKDNCYVISGLYRDGFLNLCASLGFYKRYSPYSINHILIQDRNGIVSETNTARIKDEILTPEKMVFDDLLFEYLDSKLNPHEISVPGELLKETYLRNYHNILNNDFLEHLQTHTKPFLKDSLDHTFLFFSNTIIDVTGAGFKYIPYDQLGDICVWESDIIQREFTYSENSGTCHFGKFIGNISGQDEPRIESIYSTIGYFINSYCDPANARAVLFYDEEITDLKNPQGGTGKGLLANALKQIRNTAKLDGKQFDSDNRFKYQQVNESTRIVWLDDIPPNTGFDIFHSIITDGWNIDRKNQPAIYIKPEESPKLLIASNSVIQGEGNTNERRQHIIEFAPYYSGLQRQGIDEPVRHEHGCTFFDSNEWDLNEWNMFYSFIVDCCQKYHFQGLISIKPKNVGRNKLMQGTSIEFVEWVEVRELKPDEEYDTKEEFRTFQESYGQEDMKQRRFTSYLRLYALSMGYEFKSRPSNNKTYFWLKKVVK